MENVSSFKRQTELFLQLLKAGDKGPRIESVINHIESKGLNEQTVFANSEDKQGKVLKYRVQITLRLLQEG